MENRPFDLRHAVQNSPGFVRQMTPDVITDFLPRALHVSHKDGLPRAVEVIPANPGNFLLPTCRKESERDYFWHGNRVITPSPHVEVMLHQLVQLIKRRPAIAFFALSDHSELSQYLSASGSIS